MKLAISGCTECSEFVPGHRVPPPCALRRRPRDAPRPAPPPPPAPLYTGARAPLPHSRQGPHSDHSAASPLTDNMNKLIVLFACIAVALGAVRQARDAPASDPLQDLQKHAAEFQKSFSETFNSITNSKNTKEFNEKLKEGSDSVLKELSTLSASLQNALVDANDKVKESLEATRTNLQRSADELRRAHPEVEHNAKQLQNSLSAAISTAVEQTKTLAKELGEHLDKANEKVAPQVKQAYDDFVKQAEQVQKKIHDAATKQ